MSGWPQVAFGDALIDVSAGSPRSKAADFLSSGRHPVVDQGDGLVAGYLDDDRLLARPQPPVIIFGDHTRRFKYVDFPFCVGADGVKILAPRSGFDARYLYRYLESIPLQSAGYSRHFKFLARISVPKPPLSEQRRIAAILDAADDLRAKRRATIAALDTLTQSVFLQMFGDPFTNPKKWPERPLGAIAKKFSDGPFGSNLKSSDYARDGVRVVRLQNIGVGRFLDDDKAFISEAHFAGLLKHECVPGDVLVGTLGDPNLRACIQPEWLQTAINKADCVQVRVDDQQASAPWLVGLLNCPGTLERARSRIQGQTRLRVSMGRLRELSVPVPPLGLQNAFAEKMDRLSESEKAARSSLAQLEVLHASLQSRAFRREL